MVSLFTLGKYANRTFLSRTSDEGEEDLMDTSSKLISEVDSGLCLENISTSLFKGAMLQFYWNLLLRQKDLTVLSPVNHKTYDMKLHVPRLIKAIFLRKSNLGML